MRLKLTLSYDGSDFFGWQRQPEKITVQGEIESALQKIYGEASFTNFAVTGSGRTDEGVHALGQVAHATVPNKIEPQKLISALNFYLPQSVRILICEEVDENFHAIKSAVSKTYQYDMYLGAENPLLQSRAMRLPQNVDIDKMSTAASLFVGKHDFMAFHCKGGTTKTTIRTVFKSEITECNLYGSDGLRFTVSANGFLYKMVRILAGTIIKVGTGKLQQDEVAELLLAGKEWTKKVPAEPQGLYLIKVEY